MKPFENPDTFKTCWNTTKIKKITTLETDPQRNQEPILVSLNHTGLKKFTFKYSLLLNQLSIDKKTYNYWKSINDLNEGQSSFYNHQPYQIKGNIQNIRNPDEFVLGFFYAAGISKKRIFQIHPGIPEDECLPDYRGMGFITYYPMSAWPIWIVDTGNGALALGDDYCFDCRLKGGSIVKPDFWE